MALERLKASTPVKTIKDLQTRLIGARRIYRRVSLCMVIMALTLLQTSCGGGGSAGSNSLQGPGDGNPLGDATSDVGSTRLRWTSVNDNSSIARGLEAVKVLVPNGWTVRGGFFWDPTLRNGGVSRDYAVFSPDRLRGFEYIRERPYFWADSIAAFTPVGEVYQFQGAELRRPLGAIDYISQFVIPQLPYQVTTVGMAEQMPEVAAAVRAISMSVSQGIAGTHSADAARVRISFRASGIDFDGEIHAWLAYFDSVDAFGSPVTIWKPERVFLLYAPAGEIETASSFLYPLALSEVLNPTWAQLPVIVENSRVAINEQVLTLNAQLAAYLQQNSAETFNLIDQTFRNANAANDRLFDSYDLYLRGVDTWQDPTSGQIELPGGFGQVWANPATGEYLMSNDVSFDPNTTLTGNWTALRRS